MKGIFAAVLPGQPYISERYAYQNYEPRGFKASEDLMYNDKTHYVILKWPPANVLGIVIKEGCFSQKDNNNLGFFIY